MTGRYAPCGDPFLAIAQLRAHADALEALAAIEEGEKPWGWTSTEWAARVEAHAALATARRAEAVRVRARADALASARRAA